MAVCTFCLGANSSSQALDNGNQLWDCHHCGQFMLASGFSLNHSHDPSAVALAQDWIFHENLHGRIPVFDQAWLEQAKSVRPA
jgi:hypothetical protein